MGVGATAVGLGDGAASVGVAVGRTRRCGPGNTMSSVPQIMLSTTSKLRTQNNVPPTPLRERPTSYLPFLLVEFTQDSHSKRQDKTPRHQGTKAVKTSGPFDSLGIKGWLRSVSPKAMAGLRLVEGDGCGAYRELALA
ncbi:MAG: hypothetical protein AMJ93_17050 [Anaerolineae bacterium SM23_84]|nr:MAG: hypothetical protein AMJ93_17050 [Anaerolineae bacterium SM23_84]